MSYLSKIQVLCGDVLDLNQRLKEKKVEDKKEKIESLKPDFDKSMLRVSFSHAYAGGFELTVTTPVSSDFFKKEKHTGGMSEFTRQLHEFIHERIGKFLGTPYIKKSDRAKKGMVDVEAMWHFYDAFFAYSLGLDLTSFMGSNPVVVRNDIHKRYLTAEKAYKEMIAFKTLATKKLKLRSQNEEEQDKIWKEEFMPEWVKISDKWKKEGISFVQLHQSKKTDKQQAVGYVTKIHKLTVL